MHLFPTSLVSRPSRTGLLLFFLSILLPWISPLQIAAKPTVLFSQSHAPQKPSHYRGLVVTANNTVWVSGTRGSVLRGKFINADIIQWDTCKTQYPRKDFRDIWALDENTAVAMSIADSAVVIKTTDGGKSWQLVYHDETPGIFLDVIEIDSKTGVGMILGDPLQGHFKSLFTTDYGSSWTEIPASDWNAPLDTLSSFFAASGTSLSIISSKANHKKQKFSLTAGFAGGGLRPQFHLVQITYQPSKNQPANIRPNQGPSGAINGTNNQSESPKINQKNNPKENPLVNPKENSVVHYMDNSKDNPPLITPQQQASSANDAWKISNYPTFELRMKGGPAWGCYGLTTYQTTKGIAVGGNYAQPAFRGDSTGAIAAYTNDILGPWRASATPPHGYRSGVCVSAGINKDSLFQLFFKDKNNQCQRFSQAHGELPHTYFYQTNHKKEIPIAICTGTSGTDISFDGGNHWLPLSEERGFNACTWSCNHLILAGNLGKVQSISLRELSNLFQQLNPPSPSR